MNEIHRHNCRAPARSVLLLLLLVLVNSPFTTEAAIHVRGQEEGQSAPGLSERAIGVTGVDGHWDSLRALAKWVWMNLRPPDQSFRLEEAESGNMVTGAASKSFEESKETVEQAATVAAKAAKVAEGAVEEAVEKTAEKLKEKMSHQEL